MNTRMDRSRLNIGVYHLRPNARTEAHIRDLAACGVDFVVCLDNDRAALDLFRKYGIGAVVTGVMPGWWGGDGNNAGKLAEAIPLVKCDAAAAGFEDHPAIWGIDIGDEPSALDFPHYGKIFDRVNTVFPKQFPYLNLYPNYASVAQNNSTQTVNQLGTATYEAHIARYLECVPADYLCYDFYLYSINVPKAYENLRVVSDACAKTGRSMWIVLQVNSNKPEVWLSENMLRFQAYTAMAYGAENIIWACYAGGWWHNHVLDADGNQTEQYEKLKKVNAEIRMLGEEYMKFRRVSTHHVTDAPLSTGAFTDVRAKEGSELVIGQMVSRHDDAQALFIAAADDPYDRAEKDVRIRFRADGRCVRAFGGCGRLPVETAEDNSYVLTLRSNGAAMIEVR